MNKYIGILLGILVCVSACQNESLEDTYKDYSGNGEIRYIGRCTDLSVLPGWKRLIVTWENNIDPIIKHVKVTWAQNGVKDSVLLERGTTEYSIESINGKELEDVNYEVTVSGVNEHGNSSIAISLFARPYTYTHEEVVSFNRMISKLYVIKNHLVLYFLTWQSNIEKAELNYTKKGGSAGSLELTKTIVNKNYYLLEDEIDPSKPIILNRTGKLPGCEDVIDFEPYEFSSARIYDADFKQEMKRQFGFDEIPDEWADNVETLYLDWSMRSFDDILNLPNLKKLVLGSRRYILDGSVTNMTYGQSSVSDLASSKFALETLNKLNELTVDRYNKHYRLISNKPYIKEKGNTNVEPEITPLDLAGLQFTMLPEDSEEFSSGLENLTDGDSNTSWDPIYLQLFTTYELTLDLKELKQMNGLRLVQKQFTRTGENSVAPATIKIKLSKDKVHWVDATYVEENPLGRSNGEINYIPFSEDVKNSEYRYIQLMVSAGAYGGFFYSGIAEVTLY